jgi:aspartyl-tRNA(Asn)/glutamyl-tRNA(Gln) amidotransferase subunit A
VKEVDAMELNNLTIHKLSDLLKRGEISSKDIVNSCLNRIEEIEHKINSFITLDKDEVLKQAEEIDRRLRNKKELGDLAGIPIAIKDNIVTKGIKTTCGSKMLEDFIPPYNATVVERLKKEGAIIFGKTNLDEFAMGSSTENSAFMVTKNPFDFERVPGGSSGGSAAAVASNEVLGALGSETGGSVRQPASFCGVVGLKPTYGLVSRYGLVAFASSLDQIGPITKDVEDCVLVLNSIVGYDPLDSTSANIEKANYKKALVNDVKGLKIGLPKEYFNDFVGNRVKEKIYQAVNVLKEMGAEVDEVSLPHTEYTLAAYYVIAPAEASSNLARFDGIRYGKGIKDFNSLNQFLIKTRSYGFGEEVKRRIMIGTYVLSSGYYDEYYQKALKIRTLIKRDFEKIFSKYDIIISPTTPTTAFKIGEKYNNPLSMYLSDMLTAAVNLAGICAISVPCGYVDGLPVGLQIIGDAFQEEKILRAAYAYEQNRDIG